MTLLHRYISHTLLKAILLILLIFIGLEIFILLATQLNSLGKGAYTLKQALIYVLLILPQQTYLLFPVAGLLGMLFGFNHLTRHHELMIMRVSGFSPFQILRYTLGTSLCLIIFMTLIGEMLAPKAKLYAEEQKLTAMSTGQALKTSSGIWLRQGQNFYHIKTVYSTKHIADVSRYTFNTQQQLLSSSFAKEGHYVNNTWQMTDIQETQLASTQVTSENIPAAQWNLAINPHLLKISQQLPEEMTLKQLSDYIEYQKRNHLTSTSHQIIFWQRIFQPFSIAVMMLLALPFTFGSSLRSKTLSLRLVLGVVTGFIFYLFNQIFPPLSQLFHFLPIIAAALPPLFFGVIGVVLFRQI